jgi:hypothetical protein
LQKLAHEPAQLGFGRAARQRRIERGRVSRRAAGIPQDFFVEPQLVAKVVIHRREIDSGPRADVAHLGRLEAGLGEDVARGFQYSGFGVVAAHG